MGERGEGERGRGERQGDKGKREEQEWKPDRQDALLRLYSRKHVSR